MCFFREEIDLDISLLWIPATLMAALAQTARNSMQRHLTDSLGMLGATQVRFLYGLPFAVLFLLAVQAFERQPLPQMGDAFFPFVSGAALAQIAGTALMLAAMRLRSFAVATVYVKTEPVQVAIFAWAVLGDAVTPLGALAVAMATAGVAILSVKSGGGKGSSWGAALLGMASGAFFALSSVGFRGAILALEGGSFLMQATFTLVVSLVLQTLLLVSVMLLLYRPVLAACLHAWRQSLFAGFMGALASQCWFIGFALTSAINVRTLGLVEVLFAQVLSRRLFAEHVSRRERLGVVLVAVGVVALLWSAT